MQIKESDQEKSSDLNLNEAKPINLGSFPSQRLSLKITLIAIFAASAISVSYVLSFIPNVEIMSAMLFIAGFLYGKKIGFSVGLISSIIYYGWNPFGVPDPFIYTACVGSMAFIGFIGGIFKSTNSKTGKVEINLSNILKLAIIGFFLTLMFDIVTNIAYAFYFNLNIGLAFLSGFPWMIVHLISNTIIFASIILPIYNNVISITY